MITGNTIRGSMVGSGPMGEAARGAAAPRVQVSFWCEAGHKTYPGFSADAVIPETWECTRCGRPAGQDRRNPPPRPRTGPYKTPLAYLKERRDPADGEAILAEALARLRSAGVAHHGAGERRPG